MATKVSYISLIWKASIFIVVCNRLVKGILLMIVVRNERLRDKYVREMKKVKKWKTGSEGQYMCPVGCCSVQCLADTVKHRMQVNCNVLLCDVHVL